MLFTSYTFYIIGFAVFLFHYFTPWRYGRLAILLASYYFYGTIEPWYVLLLFGSTLIDFKAAQWIGGSDNISHRRLFLYLSLAGNLGMLFIFKYGDFVLENINWLAFESGSGIPLFNFLLPVGISFYTFQTLSYTIDVYRKRVEPNRDFIEFAIYVSFFPQLVAGPIERASKMLPQLRQKNRVTKEDYELGFQRILWGLVKKLVLADRLAVVVNMTYDNPGDFGGFLTLLSLYCFMFQLYLDFSSYTDIAIGTARLFGIRLSENFDWPFLSENPPEFWSRWHMTLTNWISDYVFRPLGGVLRHNPRRTFFNVVLSMVLIGVWHGASWNFFAFGAAIGLSSGFYFLIKLMPRFQRKKLLGEYFWSKPLAIKLNFLWFVIIVGPLFRSDSLEQVFTIWGSLLDFSNPWDSSYAVYLIMVVGLIMGHIVRGTYLNHRKPIRLQPIVRGIFWAFLVLLLVYARVDYAEEFIYFEF